MTFRSKYWSSNNLIDKIRIWAGHEKPNYATAEDWKSWRVAYKNAHPNLYWFTEKFIYGLQDVVNWPVDTYRKICYGINARFKDKYWCLGSSLHKWKYHEIDTRMLECNFETLRTFVEEELASQCLYDHDSSDNFIDNSKRFGRKWYHKNRIISFFVPHWKSRAAGLEYLEWARNLRIDDDYLGNHEPSIKESKENGTYNTPTTQALKAEKILELYTWWADVRPNRPDPHEVSGLDEYYKQLKFDTFEILNDNNPERMKMYDDCNTLEEQQYQEDTDMLVKLVQLRQSLWS